VQAVWSWQRSATRIGYALLALYALHAIIGAAAQKMGTTLPFLLGNIGQTLLFFSATVLIVAGFIQKDVESESRGWLAALDDNGERYAMLVFYVFICMVIVQEVLRRFVLNYSSAWAQETAQYAFIYLGYIGAAFAVKERAHIRFDILLQRLPARLHGWVYLFAEFCTLVFAIIATYWCMHTIEQLWHFEGTTPVLRVNKIWAEAALPIGFTLMIVRCLQMMWRDIADIRAGRPAYVGKSMFEE
jgi:TRAP-type C4-dicarboxylate transport system permease small subunit